jgi:hypothetical protein
VQAFDPQMLTVRVKVPTNAQSFSMSANFYSSEFPEYTCSPFNDFFVVLLDSTFDGIPANPTDKNLAFYKRPGSTAQVPVGANLAHGNTGLFQQCRNGRTGCLGNVSGTISTCASTEQLMGTGFEDPSPGNCDGGSLSGGASGWLKIAGNVKPGEIITVRIGVWDTSDPQFDSTVLIDNWQWSTELADPGTVTFISQ